MPDYEWVSSGSQCRAIGLSMSGPNCCTLYRGHAGPHQNSFGWTFLVAVDSSMFLHDAMAQLHRCPHHKKYKAIKIPASPCIGCWRLWVLTHPDAGLERRWLVAIPEACCSRDTDGDGNCPIHAAPGVPRLATARTPQKPDRRQSTRRRDDKRRAAIARQ